MYSPSSTRNTRLAVIFWLYRTDPNNAKDWTCSSPGEALASARLMAPPSWQVSASGIRSNASTGVGPKFERRIADLRVARMAVKVSCEHRRVARCVFTDAPSRGWRFSSAPYQLSGMGVYWRWVTRLESASRSFARSAMLDSEVDSERSAKDLCCSVDVILQEMRKRVVENDWWSVDGGGPECLTPAGEGGQRAWKRARERNRRALVSTDRLILPL
jgi:hypothetical protein